jgi:hypothetical protein
MMLMMMMFIGSRQEAGQKILIFALLGRALVSLSKIWRE